MSKPTDCPSRHQVKYAGEQVIPDQYSANTRVTATLLRSVARGGVRDDHDNIDVVFTGALLDAVRAVQELRRLTTEAYLLLHTLDDGREARCECDPSVGMAPCFGCALKNWLRDAGRAGFEGT